MKRPLRALSGIALGMILTSTSVGCRSTNPEIPPRRMFRNDGSLTDAPPIGFSTEPRPSPGNAATGAPLGESPAARPRFGRNSPDRMTRPDAPTGLGEPPKLEGPPPQPLDEPIASERPRGVMGSPDAPPSPL